MPSKMKTSTFSIESINKTKNRKMKKQRYNLESLSKQIRKTWIHRRKDNQQNQRQAILSQAVLGHESHLQKTVTHAPTQ